MILVTEPQPFGNCGSNCFALTTTEAARLRSEVLRKTFRMDPNSPSIISDLLRTMAVGTNRYDKLINTLPQSISRDDLKLFETVAKQFLSQHAADDGISER